MLIPVNRPLISSEDIMCVAQTLKDTFISGDTLPIKLMEDKLSEILGISNVVAVNSGTSAIDLSVEALGIEDGYECVLPTFTIISTVTNLLRKNAFIRLVDSDINTWSINAETAADVISNQTKLVLPVHIYGLPVDLKPILEAANKFGVFVLEDAAEALGLKYQDQYCGTLGNAGIFSFYANKIVTGGEGGAVVSSDNDFAQRIRYFRNLCFKQNERYVHTDLGWNYRLGGMNSALILSQLSRLEQLIIQKQELAKVYLENLKGHPWFDFHPEKTKYSKNLYWVFGILLNSECPFDAKTLQSKLRELGVDTRRFFCPIHLQPFFRKFHFDLVGKMEVSERLWDRGLYLPSGLGNTHGEIAKVIEILWGLVKK